MHGTTRAAYNRLNLASRAPFMKTAHAQVLVAVVAISSLTGPRPLIAQTSQPKLSFEVASVKPSPPFDPAKVEADARAGRAARVGVFISSSRAEYLHLSLKQLIALAYRMRSYQVSGPGWLGTEAFDIEATIPEGASQEDAPAMLRSLLEERFNLTAHRATEEQKVLALELGKNGLKLKESATKPEPIDESVPLKPGETEAKSGFGTVRIARRGDGSATRNMGEKGTLTYKYNYGSPNQVLQIESSFIHLESNCVTMSGFADTLTMILQGFRGQQVVDMTDLKGAYELAANLSIFDLMSMAHVPGLEPSGAEAGAPNAVPAIVTPASAGDSLFHAVEKMGLKLEERKTPAEVMIIDRVDKMPTEN